MSLPTYLPVPLFRVRNWFVNFRIWWTSRGLKPATFPPGHTLRGQLDIAEHYDIGPLQCLQDLRHLYREHYFRINRKLLLKVGRVRKEGLRGLVTFVHPDCVPRFTLEFSISGGSVLIVFQDLECVDDDCARVFTYGTFFAQEYYELICDFVDRFEFALLPKDARISDEGRSLQK